jgi:hypothetical protein
VAAQFWGTLRIRIPQNWGLGGKCRDEWDFSNSL